MKTFKVAMPHDLVDSIRPKRTIAGYLVDDGYWHDEVSIRFDDGSTVGIRSDEHCLAPLFDCYTLKIVEVIDDSNRVTEVSPPFTIENAATLRRAEWLIPAIEFEDTALGNNSHMQLSGAPETIPQNATASALLIAGVLLHSTDERRLAIIASESVPGNVDLVFDANEIDTLLEGHEIVGEHPN